MLASGEQLPLLLLEEERAVVKALSEVSLADSLPLGDLVSLLLLQVLQVVFEALPPGAYQLEGVRSNLLPHFFHVKRLVQRLLVKALNELVVLRGEDLRLVQLTSGIASLVCLAPVQR